MESQSECSESRHPQMYAQEKSWLTQLVGVRVARPARTQNLMPASWPFKKTFIHGSIECLGKSHK